MTDIRDAEPQPPDDSGGYCCVAAGMHMGHDEECPNYGMNALRSIGANLAHMLAWAGQSQRALTSRQVADAIRTMCQEMLAILDKEASNE